jgi:molecular chaperone DnaJ
MVTKEDYYAILGIPRDAGDKEIKKAFRKLARQYHPDVNPGDKQAEQRFKEVNAAYEILSDPEKRRQYDQFGPAAFAQAGPGAEEAFRRAGFDFFRPAEGGETGFGFEDLFGDLFGRRERRAGPQRGEDLSYALEIDLEDAIYGLSTQVAFHREAVCGDCRGTGQEPGTRPETCPRCKGTGGVSMVRGPIRFAQTCPQCGGAGTVNPHLCKACGGRGSVGKAERVQVRIPPGVDHDSRIRLAGMGEAGLRGGSPGNLYIITRIRSHPFFKRQGDDLHCEVPITVQEAASGAKVEVPTIDRMASMTIPPGTQSGQQFRLRGKGVPHLKGGGSGDQYVTVKVVIPRVTDPQGQQILKAFGERYPEDPRAAITFRGFRKRAGG